MPAEDLRILFVEDSQIDVELETRELRKAGLAFASLRVETGQDLRAALKTFRPTIIISDFSLPQLDGLGALRIAKEQAPEIPFVFCSGTIGEERAIESLRSGATDYVLKDRIKSLAPKVRRAIEEARECTRVRRARSMDAIGRVTGGFVNDFNNMLTVITGYAELLQARLPGDGDLQSYAGEIRKAAERASALSRQLLVVSRRQILVPRLVNLNAIVARIEGVAATLDPELGDVRTDPAQAEEMIRNLVANGREAGGQVTIETSNVDRDVVVAVHDTGCGMDAATQARLFEPFFTTKGKRSGLGLATVYGLVTQCGGRVDVRSEPGKGSTFKVSLPRARDPETVLLIEGSTADRRVLIAALAQRGYRVHFAGSRDEALEIAKGLGSLQLLVTSDPALAAEILRSRPGLKVLPNEDIATLL